MFADILLRCVLLVVWHILVLVRIPVIWRRMGKFICSLRVSAAAGRRYWLRFRPWCARRSCRSLSAVQMCSG